MTSADLTDAYFSIEIDPEYRTFLCFSWRKQYYVFKVLPFGLASAPRIFTKLLKPVFDWFRQQGIRCSYYIDDSLCLNQTFASCVRDTKRMTDKLEVLGFSINYEKSVLQPSQRIIFVGVIIDTVQFKVFLTQENNDKIKTSCKRVIENHCNTIRTLASLMGLIIHAFNAVTYDQLHYRNLERDKIKHLRIN